MTSADQNLLFGILALQNGFVAGKQLIAAMNAWVLEKQTPLGQILLRLDAIQPDDLSLLDSLVTRHLAAHGNDPQQSLAAANSLETVRAELRSIVDTDIQASLAHVTNGSAADPYATVPYSPPVDSPAGSRFRILRHHASGGLGEVFVAEDGELRREVALKQIQVKYADRTDSRNRFLLEAEITGGLEHPGIVPVYSLGAYANGRPYYAMRFIRGESLQDAIERFHEAEIDAERNTSERALELRRLLRHLIDTCNAIEYAHSRGVLHRDLKPGNIMLGNYGETLVVDWGLAKVVKQQASADSAAGGDDLGSTAPFSGSGSAPTQMGTVVGTPHFMSPEQAAGRHDALSPASEVYCLGATLYCLLTGRAPLADIRGSNVGEILRRVQRGDIPAPRKIKPDIPKPLDAICRKAMSLSPANRYQSSRELADELEHWLADEPTIAQPETVYDRLFRFARRHRSVAIATTVAAMLVAIVASVAGLIVNEQRRVADQLAGKNAELAVSEQKSAVEARRERKNAELASEQAKADRKDALDRAKEARDARDDAQKALAREEIARSKATELASKNEQLATLEKANREKADKQREKADKLSEFLIVAIQPNDPTRFTGANFFAPKANYETYTVHKMLTLARQRAIDELEGTPQIQAAVFDSLGDACRQLALFRGAKELLEKSLELRRLHPGEDNADLATSCFHTGWYYHERGDFEKAKSLYEDALKIRRKLPHGRSLVADALQNLAWLHYYNDAPEEGDNCLQEALEIRRKLLEEGPAYQRKNLLRDVVFTQLGMASARAMQQRHLQARRIVTDPVFVAQLTELEGKNLADALAAFVNALDNSALKPDVALKEFTRARDLIRGEGQAKTVLAGFVHYELARIYDRRGRLPDAENEFRAAIKIARDEGMLQNPKQSKRIGEFTDLLRRQKKNEEADAIWKEYVNAQRIRFGENHKFYQEANSAYDNYRAGKAVE